MQKLTTQKCGGEAVEAPGLHRWAAAPVIDVGELGPIAWWKCTECPAMALHDPETEDGFQAEIVVVYPPSCFDADPEAWRRADRCGCPAKASGEIVHLELCPEGQALAEAASRARSPDAIGPATCDLCGAQAGYTANDRGAYGAPAGWRMEPTGEAFGLTKAPAYRLVCAAHPPEPAIIVHPPSEPPPPILEDDLPW